LIASDGHDRVQRCDWPVPLAPEAFETTVVPFMQGMLERGQNNLLIRLKGAGFFSSTYERGRSSLSLQRQ
jgi:hypothetical protein